MVSKVKTDLQDLSDEELLKLRICDLPLSISGTWLEDCVQQLYDELAEKGIHFKPACYLADEWLTPEHEPVIGLPFYLAHPALIKLEKKMMLEVEGGTRETCMKLLRHEAGHALCYAYQLHRRKKWKEVFGSPSQEYPETFRFKPYSKSYVRHLDGYYAQFHPDEDFVETFAVWLTPGMEWDKAYHGWKALKKLKFVHQLMLSIAGRPPLKEVGKKHFLYSKTRITLQRFYHRKRQDWAEDFPDFHDSNLCRIFVIAEESSKNAKPAADLIRTHHRDILNQVARWTGETKYIIHDLLKMIRKRCREMKLIVPVSDEAALIQLTAYVTTLVMNYVYTGWYRGDKSRRKKK